MKYIVKIFKNLNNVKDSDVEQLLATGVLDKAALILGRLVGLRCIGVSGLDLLLLVCIDHVVILLRILMVDKNHRLSSRDLLRPLPVIVEL